MSDAYLDYTRRFFGKWAALYDWFALAVAPAYRGAVRAAGAAPGVSIVDLCTGTGEVARRCARAGATVVGVDVTEAMLTRARRKTAGLPVELRLGDARRLDVPDDSFDVAVVSFALHDMPWRARGEVLAEAARVARRRLVVLDYDFPRWWPLRRLLIAAVATFETAYFRGFARRGLPTFLAAQGLRASSRKRFPALLCSVHEVPLGATESAA